MVLAGIGAVGCSISEQGVRGAGKFNYRTFDCYPSNIQVYEVSSAVDDRCLLHYTLCIRRYPPLVSFVTALG